MPEHLDEDSILVDIMDKATFFQSYTYQAEPTYDSWWEGGNEYSTVKQELDRLKKEGVIRTLEDLKFVKELARQVYCEYPPCSSHTGGMLTPVLSVLPRLRGISLADLVEISKKSKHYRIFHGAMPGTPSMSIAGDVLIELAELAETIPDENILEVGLELALSSHNVADGTFGLDLEPLRKTARDIQQKYQK